MMVYINPSGLAERGAREAVCAIRPLAGKTAPLRLRQAFSETPDGERPKQQGLPSVHPNVPQ